MLVAAVYIATGLVWTGRSLLEVTARPDYWDPVALVDWIAVWSYSVAFALLAIAVPLLARDARAGRLVQIIAGIVALAAALAAVGNVAEDAFDIGAASTVYVIGALGTLIGLVAFAVGLAALRRTTFATVAALMTVGVAMTVGGLGFLVLVGALMATRDHLSPLRQADAAPS
jgi:hypothetical protein